ncbi:MAG: acyltransferase [Chloroflexota bacterium]
MKKQTGFLKIDFDTNRIYGLDILRAMSILFVVATHGNNLLPAKNNPIGYFIFDGVSIFFVLSGFLIGGILIKILEEKEPSLKNLLDFYSRRWLRTLPNYFLILSLLVFLAYFFTAEFKFSEIYKYYLFSQNLYTPHPGFFPEAWSLSIEEWFYLTIPAIFFFLVGVFHTPVKRTVLITAVVVLLLSISFRYFRYSQITVETINEWDLLYRKQVVTRLDSLMFGVIGAYISYYYKSSWLRHKDILLILGLIALITTKLMTIFELNGLGLYYCVFSFTVTAVGTLFLLPFLSEFKSGSGILYRGLTYISITSYSMYLINLSVVQVWMLRHLPSLNLPKIPYLIGNYLLYWVFTLVGGILIYKYYEKPIMDLRGKIKLFEAGTLINTVNKIVTRRQHP